jgi:iron complex transport system substrate-binding protein
MAHTTIIVAPVPRARVCAEWRSQRVRIRLMRQALRRLPGLLLFTSILGCGCFHTDNTNVGGKELSNPARRIVSLSPGATEVLAKQGAINFIVGRTESCNFPAYVKKIPVVASVKPDYEKVAKQRADLIVYDPDLFNASDVEQMTRLSRLKPFALGGDTVKEFEDNLYMLAKLYTGETFVSEYVDKIEAAKEASMGDPLHPTPSVAIVLPGASAEHMIAGVDSFYADEVRLASAKPVGPSGKKFESLNAESLIKMNPDIILVAGDPSIFGSDPRFASMTAVKKKRVTGIIQDAMLRRGSRVDLVISQLHSRFAELMR